MLSRRKYNASIRPGSVLSKSISFDRKHARTWIIIFILVLSNVQRTLGRSDCIHYNLKSILGDGSSCQTTQYNRWGRGEAKLWGSFLSFAKIQHPRLDPAQLLFRGGAVSDDESEDEEDESDDESTDDDEEDDDELQNEETTAIDNISTQSLTEYDEPLAPSPFINLYASLGVMLLARKFDLFHPTMVKIARFGFISYLILLQIFLLYVRIKAKVNNNRTPLEITSPITSVLQSQLGGSGGMIKNLASSFLSSKSTYVEYDLKQTRSMQSGLIFNMLFMWFLHFKMEQVQPLFIQTVTGFSNMVYSPLFQVYVFGRNLERPFKAAVKASEEADDSEEVADETATDDALLPSSESNEKEVEVIEENDALLPSSEDNEKEVEVIEENDSDDE